MEVLHNLMEELWDRTNEYPNIEREKTKNLLQLLYQKNGIGNKYNSYFNVITKNIFLFLL